MSITPSTKIKIGLPVAQIKYLAKGNALTYEEVLTLLHDMLLYVLDELMAELRDWINTKVPKRTGQLRDNLLRNLESSNVKKGLMRLVLGTNIDYAPDVAEMTTSQVRHSGEVGYAYYYGKFGRMILDDPEAIGNFWDVLIAYAKERTKTILARAINEYFAGTGTLIKTVRGEL